MRRLFVAMALLLLSGSAFAEYSFTVNNNTDTKIVSLLVSEDGNNWGKFDIGSGIDAGKSAQLVWAAHTDNSNCEWQIRAVYADGSETNPVPFDFCEENLSLDFD